MTRRATIRTTHDDPAVVADAIAPDNTLEMETTAADGAVVTRIARGTTGGLHATVDDYVVNLDVATTVAQHANRPDADRSETSAADGPNASGAFDADRSNARRTAGTDESDDPDAGDASDPEHDNT